MQTLLPSYRSRGRIAQGVFQAMLPLIIVIVIAVAVAIGGYQLLIQKYYWGPNGPPKKDEQKKDSSQK
jgi:hypothetical protein